MTVGICGLGLIGGSLAKAYALAGARVLGYDTDAGVCTLAMADGVLAGLLTQETAAECELLLVAVYPQAAMEYMRRIAPFLKKETMLIDCCGTKRLVCEEGFRLAHEYGFTYVGGHPMAGTHFSGFAASRATL
ncbi:MAG: prephenate dehydrogenase/arogenate dehydrogenase family protein, partial [Eubacteriales bacterium]|nr:prephenate dehydrogenase/arogenate dehydrogenase family protein [Eubacteriales bacterium]